MNSIHKLSINEYLIWHVNGHVIDIHVNLGEKTKQSNLNNNNMILHGYEGVCISLQLLTVLQENSSLPSPLDLKIDSLTNASNLQQIQHKENLII